MKNLFGFQKNDSQRRYAKYVTKRQTVALEDRIIELESVKHNTLPLLIVFKSIFSIVTPIGLILFVRLLFDGASKMLDENLIKFIISISLLGSGLLIFGPIVLFLIIKSSQRTTRTTEWIELENEAMESLNIPSDSITIDILHSPIKFDLNGNEKINNNEFRQFINLPYKAYVENGNLCLSDLKQIISIPLNKFERIEKVEVKSFLSKWNKEVGFKDEKYNIKKTPFGPALINYYTFIFKDNEEYGINVPTYDAFDLAKLVNIEPNEDFTNNNKK